MNHPDPYPIVPFAGPVHATVTVPGSKSLTNRALVLAALAPEATLTGALASDDTAVMCDCLRRLGWTVIEDATAATIHVRRPAGPRIIPATSADLYVGNSGTTVRFLTALLALGEGTYRLDGVPRMRERPIGDLLDALRQLGVETDCPTGCPPLTIHARGLGGGRVEIRSDKSSQFLSALLLIAPFTADVLEIAVAGTLVSEPYVTMTVELLRARGLSIETPTPGLFRVPGQQSWVGGELAIEPDASSASYFFAAAAITGGRVTVRGLGDDSLQGDVQFVDVLEKMGCRVERCAEGITVYGRPMTGVTMDMNAISDTVMTLGVVACFAKGPTTMTNIGHIRHKETDRIAALATELRKVGATVEEWADGMTITPNPLHGATMDTYDDHRMAMSLALIGMRVPGIAVRDPGCTAKTYPGFWSDFERLRPKVMP